MDPTEVKKSDFCPYLGLARDPETRFDFPSPLNCCHCVKKARPVRLEVQESTCLTAAHLDCPVFTGRSSSGSWKGFQRQASGARPLPVMWKRWLWLLPGLLVLMLGLAVLAVLTSRMLGTASPASSQNLTSPTMQALIATAVASTETAASAVVPASAVAGVSIEAEAAGGAPAVAASTPTAPPPPTATPPLGPPTPGPGIATPFGPLRNGQGGYLLHQVEPGETMASLAETYHTTVAVLAAANQPVEVHLTAQAVLAGADVQVTDSRLSPGTLLVVLPYQTDPAGVPRFRVIFTEEEVQVVDLVVSEGVSVDDLRFYNSLSGDAIPAGRWLIIPEYP